MTTLLTLVVSMAVVTWLTLIAASLIRARVWTPQGLQVGMGNRDNLPTPTGFAGRADRTARNTLENFLLFAVLALTAHVGGATSPLVLLGAQVFVATRLVFVAVYYLGVPVVRTVVWLVGVVGLGMMVYGMYQ
jgi:uncharacterized MAPEG superfamily protein